MTLHFEYSFPRYLAAKKSVDDRALNKEVKEMLAQLVPMHTADQPLRVLEVGAGIGTMIERLLDWKIFSHAVYTAVDLEPANIAAAQERLAPGPNVQVNLEANDIFNFGDRESGQRTWDLLVAHAFLDLIHVPAALPLLFSLLQPKGLFYFSLNFDGATILQPEIDPVFDALVEALYHRTMDERMTNGKLSGDSQTGRHLFHQLQTTGAEILAAGSSDWVVYAGKDGYPGDEAYFLHFIVETIHRALFSHPDLDQERFASWIAQRQAQIEAGDLVYIAHQLDFVGRRKS
jgi:SAM-dependent methyltransferase